MKSLAIQPAKPKWSDVVHSYVCLHICAETIELLFVRVDDCSDEFLETGLFESCQDYWDDVSDTMRERSFEVAGFWAIVAFGCIAGNML
jgi:hypothetical protein